MLGHSHQLLLSSLRAKHVALRHLGLAGKVVIVDEVHAYDAYMEVYLFRALEWLGAYGVPVVLLSATLPERSRAELMSAYRRGVRSATPARRTDWRTRPRKPEGPERKPEPIPLADSPYPAVTAYIDGVSVSRPVRAFGRSTAVSIKIAADDLESLAGLLRDAVGSGGCALIVRNTVRRAQQAARELRTSFGDDVVLAHSRFLACDRVALDTWSSPR